MLEAIYMYNVMVQIYKKVAFETFREEPHDQKLIFALEFSDRL